MQASTRKCLIFLFLLCIKILLGLLFYNFYELNPDEDSNYNVAAHFLHFGAYPKTAFYGSGTVFLYQILIHFGISKHAFLITYFLLQNTLYFCSLFWFYHIARFFMSDRFSLAASIIYGLYPSVLYFIGSLFVYENVTLYGMIYLTYILLKIFNGHPTSSRSIAACIFIMPVSALLRGQFLPIYLLIFTGCGFILLFYRSTLKRKTELRKFVLIAILGSAGIAASHYPILKKNRTIFGVPILSTQVGFELLQGHSPVARGSWMGAWQQQGNALYEYAHQMIPELEKLDEYQESEKRKALALNWMIHHPREELILSLRKLAIYFLPYNFEALPYYRIFNPINATMHLMFLFSLCILLFRVKESRLRNLLIISLPILASVTLSVVFFVGYRWRYYAEPFMIIIGLTGLSEFIWPALRKYRQQKADRSNQ